MKRRRYNEIGQPPGERRLVQHSAIRQGDKEMTYPETDFKKQQTEKRQPKQRRATIGEQLIAANTICTQPHQSKHTKNTKNTEKSSNHKKEASQKKQHPIATKYETAESVIKTANEGNERDLYNRTLAS